MQSAVLAEIDDPSLRAYVIWLPILPEDSQTTALEARSLVSDPRASHFWDAERSLPPLFAPLLGLPEGWTAWDVYLLYGPGMTWGQVPPAPVYWEHQLGDQVDAPTLDGRHFAGRVRALLGESRR